MDRRKFVASTSLATVATFLSKNVFAQEYPKNGATIRYVVPFPPGGASDALARTVAQKMGEQSSQTFVVENRPGAASTIGIAEAAKTPADGYTLLMGSSTTFSINPAIRAKLPYDPVRDYTPITQCALTPVMLRFIQGVLNMVTVPFIARCARLPKPVRSQSCSAAITPSPGQMRRRSQSSVGQKASASCTLTRMPIPHQMATARCTVTARRCVA